MQDRLIYSSFNHYSLLLAREADPSVKIGLLYNEAIIDPFIYARHVKADAVHPYYPTLAAPGVIEGCKKYGIKIHPWTVNDQKAMRRLIGAGVDAIITDTPDVALKILEEEKTQ
jgi:glycerophosphoryl diester phosphodiesterase